MSKTKENKKHNSSLKESSIKSTVLKEDKIDVLEDNLHEEKELTSEVCFDINNDNLFSSNSVDSIVKMLIKQSDCTEDLVHLIKSSVNKNNLTIKKLCEVFTQLHFKDDENMFNYEVDALVHLSESNLRQERIITVKMIVYYLREDFKRNCAQNKDFFDIYVENVILTRSRDVDSSIRKECLGFLEGIVDVLHKNRKKHGNKDDCGKLKNLKNNLDTQSNIFDKKFTKILYNLLFDTNEGVRKKALKVLYKYMGKKNSFDNGFLFNSKESINKLMNINNENVLKMFLNYLKAKKNDPDSAKLFTNDSLVEYLRKHFKLKNTEENVENTTILKLMLSTKRLLIVTLTKCTNANILSFNTLNKVLEIFIKNKIDFSCISGVYGILDVCAMINDEENYENIVEFLTYESNKEKTNINRLFTGHKNISENFLLNVTGDVFANKILFNALNKFKNNNNVLKAFCALISNVFNGVNKENDFFSHTETIENILQLFSTRIRNTDEYVFLLKKLVEVGFDNFKKYVGEVNDKILLIKHFNPVEINYNTFNSFNEVLYKIMWEMKDKNYQNIKMIIKKVKENLNEDINSSKNNKNSSFNENDNELIFNIKTPLSTNKNGISTTISFCELIDDILLKNNIKINHLENTNVLVNDNQIENDTNKTFDDDLNASIKINTIMINLCDFITWYIRLNLNVFVSNIFNAIRLYNLHYFKMEEDILYDFIITNILKRPDLLSNENSKEKMSNTNVSLSIFTLCEILKDNSLILYFYLSRNIPIENKLSKILCKNIKKNATGKKIFSKYELFDVFKQFIADYTHLDCLVPFISCLTINECIIIDGMIRNNLSYDESSKNQFKNSLMKKISKVEKESIIEI
ncbi:hypothetical protein EHP00_2696 [Ecytonucleospora hepatopenaei]|uniref:Uncharacterized protein n=1 Tax=Ecytonucleospora hepatopenaei TaxID=646526 RepID=A0A1W0E634_9MICR|nr:hypothetical protein EHP00_765 [Ecytonucleospora hepatopenaei]OQS55305.1 hypothetical protein EHP00_2696 [Ecytonucleospora hepatopenaei]